MDLDRLRSGAATFGVSLSKEQLEIFDNYAALLHEANRKANLVANAEADIVLVSHLLDSLSCLAVTAIEPGWRVLDVGSGAGLPGLPLAIAVPSARVVLLDSVDKRTRFLRQVTRELGLGNVEVVGGRAEGIARDNRYRDAFDLVVARAVAPLPILVEYSLPFVKTGAEFIALRGPKADEETAAAEAAITELKGQLLEVRAVTVPWLHAERRLVVVKKTGPTPQRYPRRTGVPAKRPL